MIICDTHCDTLYKLSQEPHKQCDISVNAFLNSPLNIQVFAMFVGIDNVYTNIAKRNKEMLSLCKIFEDNGISKTVDFNINNYNSNSKNYILSIEGCECIDNEEDLIFYYNQGVRMAGITWNYVNKYGTPACVDDTSGLSREGKKLVAKLMDLKIAVDASHLNIAGFYDLINEFEKPILASHSCAYSLCQHKRNLDDNQLKAIFNKKGYVGLNFYPGFLSNSSKANCDTLVDHILYMMDRGGENYIGLGSDFDGIEIKPSDLNSPLEYNNLFDRMLSRGISQNQIEKVAGINFLEYMNRL